MPRERFFDDVGSVHPLPQNLVEYGPDLRGQRLLDVRNSDTGSSLVAASQLRPVFGTATGSAAVRAAAITAMAPPDLPAAPGPSVVLPESL